MSCDNFCAKLSLIKKYLNDLNVKIFLNVRSDVFLLGSHNAVEQAVQRVINYEKSGADGVFFPCIEKAEHIKTVVNATSLPVNIMSVPGLPKISTLASLGVKRISTGNFAHEHLYKYFTNLLCEIKNKQDFQCLFS